MPRHGIVQLLHDRASKVFRPRPKLTPQKQKKPLVEDSLSRRRDAALRNRDIVDTQLFKLVRSLQDCLAELAKRERMANSKIPSAWKWPLTDDEFDLQIREMAEWWEAQLDWRSWTEIGREASRLAWASLRNRRLVQDLEITIMRRDIVDHDKWRYLHLEWVRREALLVRGERDALAFDQELCASKKRNLISAGRLREQERSLSCGIVEEGLLAQANLWSAERRQRKKERAALEEEWKQMHIQLCAQRMPSSAQFTKM